MSLRKKEAMEILADIKGGEDIDLSGLEDSESNENMSEEKPQVEMPEPQEEKPMGLMSRRVA
jgi:hypothetical protein